MSLIKAVTICHMQPEIVAYSMQRLAATAGRFPDEWHFVDNIWPLDREQSSKRIMELHTLANEWSQVYLWKPERNLGGHGGVSYAIPRMHVSDDDLVLVYDPDSNPVTPGWMLAMERVMKDDPSMGYLSLSHQAIVEQRPWSYEVIGGYKVASLPHPEMWNATMFRGSVIKDGMKSNADRHGAQFYGHVETAMWAHSRQMGLRSGYLYDFREDFCPIPHPQIYNDWKQKHAFGKYAGNFDQYAQEHT